MDLVTRNLLDSFREEFGFLEEMEEPILFEHFCNYCICSKEYPDDFEVEDLHVAGGNDLQLDGVAIIVNGLLVDEIEQIDDLSNTNKYVVAELIFVQAKTGRNFEGSEISNMFYGVRDLFAANPSLPRNERLSGKEKLLRHIYTKSRLFRHGNPKIRLYYVTTGKWENDEKLQARINTELSSLEDLNIFASPPSFEPVNARRLQDYFKRAQNILSKTITFANKVTLPPMEGIREAYLGYIPAKAYAELISDENGALLRSIFYDNVRDFQGDNPVNSEIAETLKTGSSDAFVIMNNGITIVSEDLTPTGDVFMLTGFQVVNGCQTSHVLFNNREILGDNVFIPIKLIIRPTGVLKNRIVKATNRQTAVKEEELSALTDFQKSLEDFYAAVPEEHRLYYERRSQQYRGVAGLEKIRIITIPMQIRSFASMFLDRPHQASRYYGTLLKDIENRIFSERHNPIAYYVSSYTFFRIESLIRRRYVENKYRPFKYHLLGIIRMQVGGTAMPEMNSNKFEKYCEKLKETLWDESSCLKAIKDSCNLLDTILLSNYERDKAKDSSIQGQAKKAFEAEQLAVGGLGSLAAKP
ncbi:MAG: AIPR protein [Desulfobacterales bacterium CG23_combo_of_CG06-09_8_20_14_all_51_8]|nr:MAG: AIPR protein [Desulfobacterales bacterium CG23_combo_of_CG06-09_8_20_14_all_51_8]